VIRSKLVIATSALGLLVAALVVFLPGVVPVPRERLVALMGQLSGTAGLGVLALLSGLIAVAQGLWSSKTPSTPPSLTPILDDTDDEDTPSGPVVGAAFDDRLRATEEVGKRTEEGEAIVREDLRKLAIDVYQQAHDCDWGTAARAIEEGTWTDTEAAAAFLGGPDAPSLPLRVWFRDVLSDSGAFYNQATRTIAAIYALQAEGTPGGASLPDSVADLERAVEPESDGEATADSWGEETATDGGEVRD